MLFSDDYIDCPAGIMVLKSRWQPLNQVGDSTGETNATASEAPVEEISEDADAEVPSEESNAEAL